MDEDTIYKIIPRHDSSTNWTLNNPILSFGEYGIEDDTHRIKRGDGITPWVELKYESLGIEQVVEQYMEETFVKKVEGKDLSSNDFSDEYKTKLEYLHNYDDTEIKEDVAVLNNRIDTLNIPQNTSDLNNNGDGVSPFATEAYVNTHGTTFKPYPEEFDTTHTTQDFLNSIYDLDLDAGMTYLGGVRLTDMPFNGNAEIEVYIYPGNVIYLILRSANISPYEWECNNHTYRGWEPIGKAYADTNFLSKTNTTAFTPTLDYHPATKKYVDDAIATALSNIPDAEEVQY